MGMDVMHMQEGSGGGRGAMCLHLLSQKGGVSSTLRLKTWRAAGERRVGEARPPVKRPLLRVTNGKVKLK